VNGIVDEGRLPLLGTGHLAGRILLIDYVKKELKLDWFMKERVVATSGDNLIAFRLFPSLQPAIHSRGDDVL